MKTNLSKHFRFEILCSKLSTIIITLIIFAISKIAIEMLKCFYSLISGADLEGYSSIPLYIHFSIIALIHFLKIQEMESTFSFHPTKKSSIFSLFVTLSSNYFNTISLFPIFGFIFYGGFFGSNPDYSNDYNILCFISFLFVLLYINSLSNDILKNLNRKILENFHELVNLPKINLLFNFTKYNLFEGIVNAKNSFFFVTIMFFILNTQSFSFSLSKFFSEILNLKIPIRVCFYGILCFLIIIKDLIIECVIYALILKKFSFSLAIPKFSKHIEKKANCLLINFLKKENENWLKSTQIYFALKDITGLNERRIEELLKETGNNGNELKKLLGEFVILIKNMKREQKLNENFKFESPFVVRLILLTIEKFLSIKEVRESEEDDVKRIRRYQKFFASVLKTDYNLN